MEDPAKSSLGQSTHLSPYIAKNIPNQWNSLDLLQSLCQEVPMRPLQVMDVCLKPPHLPKKEPFVVEELSVCPQYLEAEPKNIFHLAPCLQNPRGLAFFWPLLTSTGAGVRTGTVKQTRKLNREAVQRPPEDISPLLLPTSPEAGLSLAVFPVPVFFPLNSFF